MTCDYATGRPIQGTAGERPYPTSPSGLRPGCVFGPRRTTPGAGNGTNYETNEATKVQARQQRADNFDRQGQALLAVHPPRSRHEPRSLLYEKSKPGQSLFSAHLLPEVRWDARGPQGRSAVPDHSGRRRGSSACPRGGGEIVTPPGRAEFGEGLPAPTPSRPAIRGQPIDDWRLRGPAVAPPPGPQYAGNPGCRRRYSTDGTVILDFSALMEQGFPADSGVLPQR